MRDDQTGPWVLALGALLLGIVAVTVEVLRRRRDRETTAIRTVRDDRSVDGGR